MTSLFTKQDLNKLPKQNFLITCERGDALLIADQNHVAVRVVASDKEHPIRVN